MVVMPVLAASDGQFQAPNRVTTVVRVDEKTGHLVRGVIVKPRTISPTVLNAAAESDAAAETAPAETATQTAAPADPAELIGLIDRIAAEQGVEESLVHSVIRAESNYNAYAVSPKGAQGIMQLIPATAKRFGVNNAFDVRDNVLGGVKYLKFLLDYYQNDYVRTIAAYNAGEAAVDKYKGVPPYSETRNYVYRVAENLKTARAHRVAEARVAEASPAVSDTYKRETYKRIETSVGSDGRVYYRTP
jgi:soluble lytic murein transglycosylase-like protein